LGGGGQVFYINFWTSWQIFAELGVNIMPWYVTRTSLTLGNANDMADMQTSETGVSTT